MSKTQNRSHVTLPEELIAEIDHVVGRQGRSAFVADLIKDELQRRKLLTALNTAKGSWKNEHHPELQQGSEKWVEQLRLHNDTRLTDRQP